MDCCVHAECLVASKIMSRLEVVAQSVTRSGDAKIDKGRYSCSMVSSMTKRPMENLLKSIAILGASALITVAKAAPPNTFSCSDFITKKAFQFEIPADGKGNLTFAAGFPVISRGELPITYYFSERTFQFGSEVEGGMFRNGIFYYHRHDSGSGTKIVSGTCRVI